MTRAGLVPLLFVLLLATAARAQDATLQGTCERLVIADQDVSASCKGSLLKLVSPTFASIAFSAAEGRTLSFTGGGTKDADGVTELPITLVAPGVTSKAGISRSPTPATGACRIAHRDGGTAFACEASAQGKRYAGTFLASGKADASTAKP